MDKNKRLVAGFINEIWNQNHFPSIDLYLHENYTDHSLPAVLPPNKEGLMQWIIGTGKSFEHKTIIEEMVCENDKLILRIKLQLKHIGVWRGLKPSGKEVLATGYRCFKVSDNRILEHWGLIDGNSIENQLKEEHHGCTIQKE